MDNLHLSDDDNGVITSGIIGLIWSMNTCVVAWCFVTSHSWQGIYVPQIFSLKCTYGDMLTGNLFTMARRVPVEGWTRDHNDTGVCGTN